MRLLDFWKYYFCCLCLLIFHQKSSNRLTHHHPPPRPPQACLLDAVLVLLSSAASRDRLLSDAALPPAFAKVCLAALDRCNGLEECVDEDGASGAGSLDAALLDKLLKVSRRWAVVGGVWAFGRGKRWGWALRRLTEARGRQ